MSEAEPLPLAGVTVLDLSDETGVFGARLLAELGARVIRVEAPGGDAIRRRPPFLDGEEGIERSFAHILYNAGKESVALDLALPGAQDALFALASRCDVVLGPCGAPERVQELYRRLHEAANPPGVVAIVFRRGADEAATDIVATAAGGLLGLGGHPEDPPNHPKGDLAYKQASLAAAQAAMALVLERERGGRAGTIVVSMQEAVNFTTIQTANANILHWQGRVPTRHAPLAAFTTYRAGDGQWVSFTIHPPNWPRYVEWVESVLGPTEMSSEAWADGTYRISQIRVQAEYTRRLCLRYPRRELIAEGQARGLLVLPVNTLEDITTDEHLRDRGFFERVAYPAAGRMLEVPGTAFRSNRWLSHWRAAPRLGEHTEAVFRDVGGLDEAAIEALFASGAAAGPRSVAPAARATSVPREAAVAWPSRGVARQPLAGVRVLDFCWAIAGPLATRLLADLGANVIKVESEYRLDPIRTIGVQPKDMWSWNTCGQYNDANVNKRAITLNLNTPEGIEIARRLAATADVVTSNYTPDRLDRWGLGYEELRRIRPDIIFANLGVMGIRGPNMGWRSYGSGIVAMCGIASLTGFPGREPMGIGTLHTDFTVPYFAALQVMAALRQRQRTGAGQYLELSQYEASLHLLDTELLRALNGGPMPVRNGNRSEFMAPHGVFPAAGEDRWVAIACRDDRDWSALSAVTGIGGPGDLAGRLRELDRIEAELAAWTRARDRWEVAALLQGAGVPAAPVEDLEDLLHGRDVAMHADYREVPLPAGVTAMVQEEPILWDGERLPIRRAPLWGEHTEEILREAGLDDEAIADVAARGVLY